MLKSFRFLLFPFSLIYGAIIVLRNYLFDKNIFKVTTFNFPIICIGNLATGGTGKSPMAEYLIALLQNKYQVATLSRGYKRKTKGFAIADSRTTALEIGDEPMQFYLKFAKATIAVGEERLSAIPQLLQAKPLTNVILLDDGYQHRSVLAGLNILLTDFNNLYSRDLLLPAGDLRDSKASANRAQIIVVTKCNPILTRQQSEAIEKSLKLKQHQKIFFTAISYDVPYHLFTKETYLLTPEVNVLLLTGIANPYPLKDYINKHSKSYDLLKYTDHHIFNSNDLIDIKKNFEKIVSKQKVIITTEKDAVRLTKFQNQISQLPIYVLPITQQFLLGGDVAFNKHVVQFIDSFANKA